MVICGDLLENRVDVTKQLQITKENSARSNNNRQTHDE